MDDEGYLAMDALTGLTLTVLALVVVLSAYGATLNLGRRATAERQANALALWVLETQWPRLHGAGLREGAAHAGWTWRLSAAVTSQREAAALCHVRITVARARTLSRQFETDRICVTS
jgi:hypothetical protein